MQFDLKLSLALCTYNGERFLRSQLESILNQTTCVNEIIVCDDHSSDNTLTILHEFEASHPSLFKIFANQENIGVIKNFEKAISLCSGDIIFLADQDDIWESNKVASVLHFFHQHPNYNAVFSDAELINEQSNYLHKTLWELLQFNEALTQNSRLNIFEFLLLYRNVVTGACLAIRKESLPHILPFPKDGKMLHDQWIGLKLGEVNKIGFINQCLIRYRLHSEQETKFIWQNHNQMSSEIRSSIIADSVNSFPLEYYRYWKKKLTALNMMRNYGLLISESIINEVRRKIRKGIIAHLKSLPFFQRKSTLLKLYLKQQKEIAFADIVKI
jgi:glycosyltransferase involved in cell wall biosynthesis